MTRNEIIDKVNEIFIDVFEDDSIIIDEKTTAADIEDWDSLSHITLLNEVESAFGFRFGMKDVHGMKNVGEMIDIIQSNIN